MNLCTIQGDGSPFYSIVINAVMETFIDESKIEEATDFFKSKNINIENNTSIQETIESIRINAAWFEKDKQAIKEYLTKSGNITESTPAVKLVHTEATMSTRT